MNQITIFKNGEPFARTLPPFYEEDVVNVAKIIGFLQNGRWVVGNGVLQIINPTGEDDILQDIISLNGTVDQVALIMAHPSVIIMAKSQDTWTFVEEPVAETQIET